VERKSVFITGGNAGIGLATALAFAAEGINVAIFARRKERNADAAARIEELGVSCLEFAGDVTDEQQLSLALRQTSEHFGGLHYAFNNAGADQRAVPVTDLTTAEYEQQLDVNLRGTFYGMKHQIPLILQSGGGAICNNASACGLVGSAYQSLYSAAKFAVVGLTKSVALEFAARSVRVNVVCPGATTGDMFLRFKQQFPEAASQAAAAHPMGRVGAKEEVAKAVLYLCRDATFTTGHAFSVDGGFTVP
jgi:NAD(P)-dependent dehydrogenase (short-subunit alcohol dehydrogenase family)